ncbi:SHOCT domain-containing protein [Bacillus wiedmannii]
MAIKYENTVMFVKKEQKMARDILKYKELLDQGIITEEEFQAKKKQLLGI